MESSKTSFERKYNPRWKMTNIIGQVIYWMLILSLGPFIPGGCIFGPIFIASGEYGSGVGLLIFSLIAFIFVSLIIFVVEYSIRSDKSNKLDSSTYKTQFKVKDKKVQYRSTKYGKFATDFTTSKGSDDVKYILINEKDEIFFVDRDMYSYVDIGDNVDTTYKNKNFVIRLDVLSKNPTPPIKEEERETTLKQEERKSYDETNLKRIITAVIAFFTLLIGSMLIGLVVGIFAYIF